MSDQWQKDRETCEAATEGPWVTSVVLHDGDQRPMDAVYRQAKDGGDGPFVCALRFLHDDKSETDADFIAAARTRWPAALDRITALEAERDAAFKRGWESAKKAAVEAVEKATLYVADPPSKVNTPRGVAYTRQSVINAIRAVKMGEQP